MFSAHMSIACHHICRLGKLRDKPCRLLRCTTIQVLGFVDTRDRTVDATLANLGNACFWETRLLRPTAKSGAPLPDRSMEREWQVSAGAAIHALGARKFRSWTFSTQSHRHWTFRGTLRRVSEWGALAGSRRSGQKTQGISWGLFASPLPVHGTRRPVGRSASHRRPPDSPPPS